MTYGDLNNAISTLASRIFSTTIIGCTIILIATIIIFAIYYVLSHKQIKEMEKAHSYYQIILMDLRMPIMDDYQATETIRHLDDRPDGKDIPILAMTEMIKKIKKYINK